MKSCQLFWLLYLSGFTLLLTSCDANQRRDVDLFKPRPAASSSYLALYGPAPVAPSGTYQALVGFLPRVDAPDKVSPFPVFQATSREAVLRLLQRLVSPEIDLLRRYDLLNPFPAGTRVLSIQQQGDVVNIDLSRQVLRQSNPVLRRAMVLSLGHALKQFPGIDKVIVSVEGIPLASQNGHIFSPSDLEVVIPGAPRIVGVAAVGESGSANPRSLAIYFDRPVVVKELLLTDDQGRVLDGEFSLDYFDMVVQLRPHASRRLTPGMRVRVLWHVADTLGVNGTGEHIFHLQRPDQP